MTCASTANLETCAAPAECCQPAVREVIYRTGHPDRPGEVTETRIGYCQRHFDKVIAKRTAAAQ